MARRVGRLLARVFGRRSGRSPFDSPWMQKLKHTYTAFACMTGIHGLIELAKGVYRKLRGPRHTAAIAQAQPKQKRAAMFLRIWYSFTIAHVVLQRVRRVRARVAHTAIEYVGHLLETQTQRAIARVMMEQRAERAKVIQRLWRQVLVKQQAHREGKNRILSLLSSMKPRIEQRETEQRELDAARVDMSTVAASTIIREAGKRVAARLIQRVWRGYCARRRVFLLCEWRQKRELRKKLRERARVAREVLLTPSPEDCERKRVLNSRVAAQKQRTPLVLPAGYRRGQREALAAARQRMARSTQLEPLQFQSKPPRVSSMTGAATMRVPFSKFEKMRAMNARVNMDNVWVAVPVGHRPVDGALASPSKRTRDRFLETQYDWVQATLLLGGVAQGEHQQQQQQEQQEQHRSAAMELLVPLE